MALNRLWNLNLSRQELQSIGLKLGADVPFFLCGHSAWVSGIGEIITPLTGRNALPQQQFLVVKPEQGLETGKIFPASP
jgi:4-diphosphocytidyl-2-C-methyl-D-erythritol kinase